MRRRHIFSSFSMLILALLAGCSGPAADDPPIADEPPAIVASNETYTEGITRSWGVIAGYRIQVAQSFRPVVSTSCSGVELDISGVSIPLPGEYSIRIETDSSNEP